jgi:hypothetical protein
MYLIADSGSTKTDWIIGYGCEYRIITTDGINPFFVDEKEIRSILENKLLVTADSVTEVYFYGAGCVDDKRESILSVLGRHFTGALISVESDMLGAARSLCGHEAGIACILGTGSNSCVYDGQKIIAHIPPLGFILGDKGSGADIGKRFIAALLRNQLPAEVQESFFSRCNLTPAEIMDRVYCGAVPGRFMAGAVKNVEGIGGIVEQCFEDFIEEQVLPYGQSTTLPVHFIGGIAYNFREELTKVLQKSGLKAGLIKQSPAEGLVRYHSH